jgi:hypothetical protein
MIGPRVDAGTSPQPYVVSARFWSKRQLAKMLDNLQLAVTELSKSEIDMRRTGYDKTYLAN